MNQSINMKKKAGYRNPMVWVSLLLIGFLFILLTACEHDPIAGPVDPDPDPNDTIDNPIDTTEEGVPCDPAVVYFTTEVLPILRSNCAKSGCHDAITQEEDIILDSYSNVMNSDDVVKPFDLDDSEMFERITDSDPDKRMPPPPHERLTADQINTIATWILQGATDLTCDENTGACNTNNITYAGFVAPLLTTNCVGCHSGGSPSGGITLNTYPGVQSVALSGRLYGAISHANGFQPMPRGSAKLSQCTIDKVKAWIDNGAQNN
jgi:mono/diheme cytochrome c family protein